MKDKIFHKAEKFNEFPWDKLIYGKYKSNGENFTFGRGGIHYVNGSGWNITIYSEDDLASENWELPRALSDMLDWQEKNGKETNQRETQHAFKTLLGIK